MSSNVTPLTTPDSYHGNVNQSGFSVAVLFSLINTATLSAKQKLIQMQQRQSSISIADMFEMQMLMNHLSQLSEMSTSVVSASNTAISSMARNVK